MIKIAGGKTPPGKTNWKQYQVPKKTHEDGIYVDVDTSSAKFRDTPNYVISISGTSNHWLANGCSSIYDPTNAGFRVYLHLSDVTPEYANKREWAVNWIGVES
ncbi:MAG: hypothetical protein QNK37_34755 [Acidobacteriota bacterium]|nr:hypothetical protein [Acidobacteriota bacterium]